SLPRDLAPVLILLSSFFLQSAVPPRDLHSFPTRRSSDLTRFAPLIEPVVIVEPLSDNVSLSAMVIAVVLIVPPLIVSLAPLATSVLMGTRLDSTLTLTSYAVLSLKTKLSVSVTLPLIEVH